MATIGWVKSRRRWRVKWHAVNHATREVFAGSRYFPGKSQALKFYLDIESQEKSWRTGDASCDESIAEARRRFELYCHRMAPRTRAHYAAALKRFYCLLPVQSTRVHQITPADVRAYIYRLQADGLSTRSVNSYLTAVKSACRFWAAEYGLPNPAAEVRLLHEQAPNVRCLTELELETILKFAGPIAADRLLFLANTGLRASELAAVTPGHSGGTALVLGKGSKRRVIPLNSIARAILPRLVPASRNALSLQFHRLAHRAGVKPFGPHSLRHYFTMKMLARGCPLPVLAVILGHTRISTTQRYVHLLGVHVEGATDLLIDP